MTAPADALAMLDFAPGCLAHPDCRNTATHWAATACCGEHALLFCSQCKTDALFTTDPWTCPRCGKTWARTADAYTEFHPLGAK